MFSVRIVTANHYVASPIQELDATFSDFRRSEVKQVPVIRIFGATPSGQKSCLHVHGVFPYIYIPYDGAQPEDKYTQQFANSLDLAIQVSLGKASVATQHVFKVSLVTGMPLYGYHTTEQPFLKIYFYNPLMVKRAVDLLQSGAVMNKVFQPHEAHVPYMLQFLMDYNLYGMNLLNVAAVKFRKPDDHKESSETLSGSSKHSGNSYDLNQSTQGSGTSKSSANRQLWNTDTIPRSQWLDDSVTRQSTCELEVDAVAVDILNRLDIEGTLGANPGLVAIWEDEKQRREQLNQIDDLLPPSSPDRGDLEDVDSELRGQARLQEIIQERINQLREAGCSEELTQSLLGESQSQEPQSPIPSSQIDFHFGNHKDDDGPPVLSREDTQPVVNEDLVQSFVEASQHSTQKQDSDKELVQLLVYLAHGESQLEEPEDDSILSGQTPRDAADDVIMDHASQAAMGTEGEDEEGVRDALESLHMSQAWDEGTPKNESFDDGEEEEEDVEEGDDEEGADYDTTEHSTLEDLENALISITEKDENTRLPQYDGAGDEEFAAENTRLPQHDGAGNKESAAKNTRLPQHDGAGNKESAAKNTRLPQHDGAGNKESAAENTRLPQHDGAGNKESAAKPPQMSFQDGSKFTRKRTIQKPFRYLDDYDDVIDVDDEEDFVNLTSIKPKTQHKKKVRPRLKKSKTKTNASSTNNVAQENDRKDKLLKEFAIQVKDRHDEEMIKRIPYWNPILMLQKCDPEITQTLDGTRNMQKQDGRHNAFNDMTVWDVKEDSLSEGMVKKTLKLGSPNKIPNLQSTKQLEFPRQSFQKLTSPGRKFATKKKKTLGIKRRRNQVDNTSDSSCTSTANQHYSMRTKRECVMYREDDDEFDSILALTEKETIVSNNKIDFSDEVIEIDDDDDCFGFEQSDSCEVILEESSLNRYKPELNLSIKGKSPLHNSPMKGIKRKSPLKGKSSVKGKGKSKLSLSRKRLMEIQAAKEILSDDDSIPELIQEVISNDDDVLLPSSDGGSDLEIDEKTGLRSLPEKKNLDSASRSNNNDSVINAGHSSRPEKNNSDDSNRPSNSDGVINKSNSYPTHISDNSRSYNSIPSSPKESTFNHHVESTNGKHQIGKMPQKAGSSNAPVKDQWGPPMFSINTDDSKDDYRDAMWGLAYFSPLRPEPEPSPPRAWSPTRTNIQQTEPQDLLNHIEGIDNEQMMKEIAEFQEDHSDIFQQFVCQPATDSTPGETGESSCSESNNQEPDKSMLDNTQSSMEIDVIPESQSEEDTMSNVATKVVEHNNNLSAKAAVKSNMKELAPPDLSLSSQNDSALSNKPKFDSVRTCKPLPLETRGDPSKKVIGKVHPTQHFKPQDDQLWNDLSQDKTSVTPVKSDSNENQNVALIAARANSFSTELQSPIESSPVFPPTSGPLSLMSPTNQPSKFFTTPKQSCAGELFPFPSSKEACSDDILNRDKSGVPPEENILTLGKSNKQSLDPNDDNQDSRKDSSLSLTTGQRSNPNGGQDLSLSVTSEQKCNHSKESILQTPESEETDSSQGQRSGQSIHDVVHDLNMQMSDPSSLLISGQRSGHDGGHDTGRRNQSDDPSIETKQDDSPENDTQMSDSSSPLTPAQRPPESSQTQSQDTQLTSQESADSPGSSDSDEPIRLDDFLPSTQTGKEDGKSTMQEISSAMLQCSENGESLPSSVATPWKTFNSDCMTPVKSDQEDLSSIDSSNRTDNLPRLKNDESLSSSAGTPWRTFDSDCMTPVKSSQEDLTSVDSAPMSANLATSGGSGYMTPVKSSQENLTSIDSVPMSANLAKSGREHCESLPSNVTTPLVTLNSACTTTKTTGQEDLASIDSSNPSHRMDNTGTAGGENVSLASSVDDSGWKVFSDDIMTPVKSAASYSSSGSNVNNENSQVIPAQSACDTVFQKPKSNSLESNEMDTESQSVGHQKPDLLPRDLKSVLKDFESFQKEIPTATQISQSETVEKTDGNVLAKSNSTMDTQVNANSEINSEKQAPAAEPIESLLESSVKRGTGIDKEENAAKRSEVQNLSDAHGCMSESIDQSSSVSSDLEMGLSNNISKDRTNSDKSMNDERLPSNSSSGSVSLFDNTKGEEGDDAETVPLDSSTASASLFDKTRVDDSYVEESISLNSSAAASVSLFDDKMENVPPNSSTGSVSLCDDKTKGNEDDIAENVPQNSSTASVTLFDKDKTDECEDAETIPTNSSTASEALFDKDKTDECDDAETIPTNSSTASEALFDKDKTDECDDAETIPTNSSTASEALFDKDKTDECDDAENNKKNSSTASESLFNEDKMDECDDAETIPTNPSTASASLFDDKTQGDEGEIIKDMLSKSASTLSDDKSNIVDDVSKEISSKSNLNTKLKARVVLTDLATSKVPAIKRKLSELSDMSDSNNDSKRTKSGENSQEAFENSQDSIEDMSIGDSSMSVSQNSGVESIDMEIKDQVGLNEDEDDLEKLVSDSRPVDHDGPISNGNHRDGDGEISPAHQALVAIATKLMKPALDPPSVSSVKESLLKHGLYEVQHQKAFWSKPEDKPTYNVRPDILHQAQPKSNVPSDLDDAQTKLSDIGLHHWRTVMSTMSNAPPTSSQAPNTAFNILHEMTNIDYKASLIGDANTIITPCKPPPSKRKVESWLKTKTMQRDDEKCTKDINNEQISAANNAVNNVHTFKTPKPAQRDDEKHRDKPFNEQNVQNRNDISMESVSMTTKEIASTSTQLPPCFASPLVRNVSLSHSTPVRGPNSQDATEPGVTPIAGCSSQRRRLSTGDGPMANLVRRQSLLFTPRECIANSQLMRGVSDTSQIEGPTPNNTYDFKLSQHNLQDAKALHEVQHLTIFSMELHVRTRRDYRPDPEADPVRAVFFCLQTDSIDGKKLEKGMIVVEEHDVGNANAAGPSSSVTSPNANQNNHTGPSSSVTSNTNHNNHTGPSSSVTSNANQNNHTGIHELDVIKVGSEKELFEEIVVLFRKHDPDILVGYEIQQLSWGFLLQRAAFLDFNLCTQISRLPESKKESTFNSEKDEYGADHMSEIHIAGRIVLNIWRLMRHEVTLNIYTFENVTFHVLHQRVPKFSFRSLSDWFDHQTNVFRWRVVEYYTLRVCCNLQLLEQRDMIGRTSELARVFGIQFYDVLSRGSQYRVESMMLRLAKPLNYIAVSPNQQQRVRMKAPEVIPLVMEPESRFYEDPVIVLDFQSLYPSMMIAYNYCFSTCLGRLEHIADGGQYTLGCQSLSIAATALKRLQNSDSLHVSPNGIVFVKQSVRHGVVPRMLDQILSTRFMVKKALKDHKKDKILERMLDNRQLGLKLIANVTYGYTAASFSGRMPCVEVADSVVRKGRETLERAIMMVESNADWNARVVYGDTDSMFILLKGASKDQAFKIGKEIAAAVTAANPKPVKLKFEKVYHPCVLQAKKRYVGFKYESPDQTEPEYDAKGIETVRRDGCPAVAKILERSIKALFTTKDLSQVKEYVQKQFKKIIDGTTSMQDLTFAKEYRGRNSYQPGACVPALEISRRMMGIDRCSEPRRGERVPYVVVCGSPGLPLIHLVRRPEEVLKDPTLRLNSTYYITRQIVPALNRVFSLMGVDTNVWYQELPKNQRVYNHAVMNPQVKKGTIAQYFSSLNCVLCDKLNKTGLCDSCQEEPQKTAAILSERIQEWNQSWRALDKMCGSCCGFRDEQPGCDSLDCPVRYKLNRTVTQLQQVPFYQSLLDTLSQ